MNEIVVVQRREESFEYVCGRLFASFVIFVVVGGGGSGSGIFLLKFSSWKSLKAERCLKKWPVAACLITSVRYVFASTTSSQRQSLPPVAASEDSIAPARTNVLLRLVEYIMT